MHTFKQFSVTMENRPGTLARMCTALGERSANVLAVMSIEQEGRSLVRMVVDKAGPCVKALESLGYEFSQEEVLATAIANRPGTLGKVAKVLGEARININYAYLGAEGASARHLLLVLSVSDPERAKALLK